MSTTRSAARAPLYFEAMIDGPDVFGGPRGGSTALPTPCHTYDGGTAICDPAYGVDITHATEMFRMRVVPHLYDERDLVLAAELRALMVAGLPGAMVDRDCYTCRTAIVTPTAGHSCPWCGSRRLSAPV